MNKTKFLISLKFLSWIGLVVLFFFVSIAAVDQRKHIQCRQIHIQFKNDKNLGFIHSKNIIEEVNQAQPHWQGKDIAKIKFNLIEQSVKQNEYVKRAELFLDNQNKLNVLVEPKKPLARIHTSYGSYYLSENWDRMSLSQNYTQRIVHISGRTGQITDPKTPMDSLIQTSISKLLEYIDQHKVWRDAIEQIYVRDNGKIDLVLSFCQPVIVLGYIDENFEKKMNKLENFIRTVSRHRDLSEYSELDFQYSQQVVARK